MRSRTVGFVSVALLLFLTAASAPAEPTGIAGERFFSLRAGLFKPDGGCWKLDSERSFYGAGLQVPIHSGVDLIASATHTGSGDPESDVWGGGFVLHADPDRRIVPIFHIGLYHLSESVPGPDPEGEQGFRFGTGLEIHDLHGFTLNAVITHTDVGGSDFLFNADLVRWFAGRFITDLGAGYGFDTETASVSLGAGVGF